MIQKSLRYYVRLSSNSFSERPHLKDQTNSQLLLMRRVAFYEIRNVGVPAGTKRGAQATELSHSSNSYPITLNIIM